MLRQKSAKRWVFMLMIGGLFISAFSSPGMVRINLTDGLDLIRTIETTGSDEQGEFDLVVAIDAYLRNIPPDLMTLTQARQLESLREAEDALVIDVRDAGAYQAGHIPGAINIPLPALTQHLHKLPADSPIITYSSSRQGAGMALTALRLLGYNNVYSFHPGYSGWLDAGGLISTQPATGKHHTVPQIEPAMLTAVEAFLTGLPGGLLGEDDPAALFDSATVVDVRGLGMYVNGHIPGAINIPIRSLARNLNQIPTDQPVYIYCQTGHLASISTAALHVMGYTNVRTFEPGYDGWLNAGGPFLMLE